MTLPQIHTAINDALAVVMLKSQRNCSEYAPIPNSLLAAQMWLVGQGFEAKPTDAELYFGWALATCRSYMDTLSADARAEEIEAGRRVIFEGRGNRPPLLASVGMERRAA